MLSRLPLSPPGDDDVVVDIEWSAISTGTERLLWSGRMPPFPGLGYPLVPGYESVGRIAAGGGRSGRRVGERVFVPGARCFGDVRGLFGGAASRLVVPAEKAVPIDEGLGEKGVLMALAATAYHVTARTGSTHPDLIVGHGVLGRLLARLGGGDGRTAADCLGAQSRAPGRGCGIRRRRSGYGSTARLSRDLRCQRQFVDPRQPDRPPGAGRRDRARGLLQRAGRLRLSRRLHARDAPSHRRRMEGTPTCRPSRP